MNKNQKGLKLILAVLAIAVLAVGLYFATSGAKAKADGKVVIDYIALDGKVIKEKTVKFYTDDTLVKLVEDNFENVEISNGMIMNMEDFVTPSDWSQFLSITVNGEMSMVGILEIKLEDGLVVGFQITEYVPQ